MMSSQSQSASTSASPSIVYPELRVNRDLLNAKFDGYKLALDQPSIVELKLPHPVDNPQLTERQYSFDHLKAYGVQNHLCLDPWDLDCAYYLDTEWNVMRVRTVVDSSPDPPRSVLQLPNAADRRLLAGRCQATMAFADETAACAADGCGRLFLINTGDRASGADEPSVNAEQSVSPALWQPMATLEVEPGLLVYARRWQGQIHCLMMRVRELTDRSTVDAKSGDGFRCVLDWLTFKAEAESSAGGDAATEGLFKKIRSVTLESTCVPNYACLDAHCRYLLLACDQPYEFVGDDKPAAPAGNAAAAQGQSNREGEATREAAAASKNGDQRRSRSNGAMTSFSSPPPYAWCQATEDNSIVVYIPLPPGVSKQDVDVENDGVELRVLVHDRPVLNGPFYDTLDKDACSWAVEQQTCGTRLLKLELRGKRDPSSRWPHLVTNDSRGDELQDVITAEAVATTVANAQCDLFNPQELEDCDFPDAGDGDSGLANGSLVWMDGDERRMVAHTALDSTQWLFATRVAPSEPPYICLRRDVDGLLWRPDSAGLVGEPEPSTSSSATTASPNSLWQHVATFNAFGFVRASKTDAKFVACAPSFGYAAICDCYRHVYVYHSPRPTDTQLRHRSTGRLVTERSSQQVISLASQDALIGFACCDSRTLVLTERALYLVRIGSGSV